MLNLLINALEAISQKLPAQATDEQGQSLIAPTTARRVNALVKLGLAGAPAEYQSMLMGLAAPIYARMGQLEDVGAHSKPRFLVHSWVGSGSHPFLEMVEQRRCLTSWFGSRAFRTVSASKR